MYQPNYTISDRLLNSIVKLESDKVLMNLTELPSSSKASLKEEAKANNLFHLAHMLGLNITLKDAAKLAEGRKLGIEGIRATIINNFRNVLEFNRSGVADSYVDLDNALMLHINKLILNNWKEPWDVKLRNTGEAVDPNLDDWTNTLVDESQRDLQQELKDILDWFKMSATRVHPVIRVAILVNALGNLQPLSAGNKITIIGLVDFLLNRYGYIENTYLPVVRIFDLYTEEYAEAWDMAKKNQDLTLWLERFARNIAKDVQELKSEVDRKATEEKEKNSKQPFLDLNKRQLKVLKYLQTIPTVKREDYCQMMDVSTMTAYRDLDDLVLKKLIKVEGKGRGTRYMLVSR